MTSIINIKTDSSQAEKSKCVANILPCQIDYNGPANANKDLWDPVDKDDDTSISYFRGRKLKGRVLKVPAGFKGHVLVPSSDDDTALTRQQFELNAEESDDDEEEKVKTEQWISTATFDKVVVYGHETMPDKENNKFLKGLDEWPAFSEIINGFDTDELAK